MFKVAEFDSSERLLATSMCVCVWAYLFCMRQKQEKMARDKTGEIDLGRMADRWRGEGRIQDLGSREGRENESNGGGCLCECINNAIKWAHLRTSHITAICLVVNL